MKNTLLASAIALAGVFGFAGAASAQSTAETELELLMQNQCSIAAPELISTEIEGVSDGYMLYTASENGTLDVICNVNLPFTVEVNTDGNGGIDLVGAATGTTVPALVYQDAGATQPFGTDANAYVGMGTGDWEPIDFQVRFNELPDRSYLPLPEADTYNATLFFEASY